MHRVHLREAEIRLAELIDKAAEGEDVVIIRSDGTSFKIVPISAVEADSNGTEASAELSDNSDNFDDFEAFEDLDDFHQSLRHETPDRVNINGSANESALFSNIFLSIFLSISVVMLAIASFSGVNTARTSAGERRAAARVVDLAVRKDQSGNDFYYPVVEFNLPDERRQVVQLSEGSWPPAYEQGESVAIRYDPQRPRNARIDSLENTILMWLLTIITGILGVSFLAASMLGYWLLKPDFAKRQQI